MTPRRYSDEGIVLARRSYSEADRIISILTKSHGRIVVLAKGVRKLTSRKRGHLEVFSQIKFQASRGKSLDILTEVETVNNFGEIRMDLKRTALAYFFMEVIGRTTHEGEPHRELYSHILENLRLLKSERKLRTLKNNFIVEVLTSLGFWPRGKVLPNPQAVLESVTERQISSARVGKKLIT
ncbi:DNA repair protein RecO [Candidatus Woesebacteria bacterium RIFCSPLOWO2_01_FULL_43_11]|uniref:DNA repair protein RecO n=1 Tax=Candidatus Woesebacteria bacterium RBG_16_42_24 TaxID=1802485 RepID=A0A1F7XKG9_9BACT|nr:MAG: DNA repair protein RecO [Candidatus Woesebacteria bacterium RBG_16_42_24]OGM67966.1 MAG: DNA repair protein RecO [Candidatus Woesebacteria bacterium RIFCSPLOWO2_01_FULL_43_11]